MSLSSQIWFPSITICGFDKADYPETTDPRVFEAVVRYIRRFTNQITIAESSGKPIPTSVSFKIAGICVGTENIGDDRVEKVI